MKDNNELEKEVSLEVSEHLRLMKEHIEKYNKLI